MVETEEAALEFLVSYEQLAEAIEPAMRDLHNPAPGAPGRVPAFFFGFLSTAFDVRNVARFFDDAKRRFTGIAGVGTQMLVAPLWWVRTLHHNSLKDCANLADIMTVCSGHDDRERDATAVHQQVTLAPIFSPDPSGSGQRILVPGEPSSSPRRRFASATR